jgi:uncharacterized protein
MNDARRHPRIWVLVGGKTGDNEQCLAVAEALGWPFAVKRLAFNPLYRAWNLLLGRSRASLDRRSSDPLEPPWPDLVIAAGRRSVPVARWIQGQNRDATRLVQIGRPRAPLDWFDLVLATPQYGLPDRPNLLQLLLPLVRAKTADPAELARWSASTAGLPRPHLALLVGGTGDPYSLDAESAARLGRTASRLARALGGSLLVSTSRRTPPEAAAALAQALDAPNYLHRWIAGGADNPYRAFLELADAAIVTADSASMIADAAATGRPVRLFLPPLKPSLQYRVNAWLSRRVRPLHRLLAAIGLLSGMRDLDRLHARLIEAGLAAWLTETPESGPTPGAGRAGASEIDRVRERVRAILPP